MASISSSNDIVLPSYHYESSTTSRRDASFSSYLNSTEETCIQTLRLKKAADDEIDVFSADKYFNGGIDKKSKGTSNYHQQVNKKQTDKAMISLSKIKLRPRTPSTHSDSSWNSQSALIRPVQRDPYRHNNEYNNNNKKEKKTSYFMSCYCCDKKSVEIEDQDHFDSRGIRSFDSEQYSGIPRTIKTSFDTAEITRLNKLRLDRKDPFAYLETNSSSLGKTIQEEGVEERQRKKSIGVFGGYNEEADIKRQPNTLPYDTESDASSDLFEIQCLSCNASPVSQGGPRHDSIGYAPSEASIDWSVATASAADNSTVLGSEDQLSSTLPSHVTGLRVDQKPSSSYVKEMLNKGSQKPRSAGMLSGCKSQKAVDVYTNSVKRKSGECQKVQRFSDSYDTVPRFQVEAKIPGHGLSQSNRISGSHRMYN